MVDVKQAEIDNDVLKEFEAAQTLASKLANDTALGTSLAEHGKAASETGVYVTLTAGAYRHGQNAAKGKKNAPDFEPLYNKWFHGKYGRDRKAGEKGRLERYGDVSAFGAWAEAGFDGREWVREYANKAFALKNVPIGRRAALVRKLVPLKAAPSDADWEKMCPKPQSGSKGGGTLKSKTSALMRAAEGLSEMGMPNELEPLFVELLEKLEEFEKEVKAIKEEKSGGTSAAAIKAAERAAAVAAIRARVRGEEPVKLDS